MYVQCMYGEKRSVAPLIITRLSGNRLILFFFFYACKRAQISVAMADREDVNLSEFGEVCGLMTFDVALSTRISQQVVNRSARAPCST